MKPLTLRQARALGLIIACEDNFGFSPTVRELSDYLGAFRDKPYTSDTSSAYTLNQLERAGYIVRSVNRNRVMRATAEARPALERFIEEFRAGLATLLEKVELADVNPEEAVEA